jgi:bifunctional DNA primase/polymerase-like protein
VVVNFFNTAADLVSLGFRVIPLVPGKKVPLTANGLNDASDDADVIATWATRWPHANIGIRTGAPSGVLIIDLDLKDGRDGMADLTTHAKAGRKLPPSPIALTPTGGRHLYFRAVPGIRNAAGITKAGRGLGSGIDVRADGGFVVAPPSMLDCGGRYRWLTPPMTADFPRLPDWAVRLLLLPPPPARSAYTPTAGGAGLEGPARFVAQAPRGTRNHALHWAACRAGEMVARREISEEAANATLTAAAAASGLAGSEVANTIASGLRAGRAQNQPTHRR